ncbi:hypothetical protein, partial [Vibrio parahaemolyticus]|uniref:hypothetical protein n=1 Tax=Vibrio parahaemolyticus TaxID=670 RepID=UPI001173F45E
AHDFAMHCTGLYADWYEGARIEGSGHYFWAIGHTIDSTTNVLQKELFGTKNAKIKEELGTGAIPLHCIDFDTMIKDGKTIKQCRIKHFDKDGNFDGYNTVQFFAAEAGTEPLMGQSVKYVHL